MISLCIILTGCTTLSCCCWIPIWNRALWRISAYTDIYPSVKRPLGSKPSSQVAAQEPGTWFVAQVTEKNVGNCKQWLKKIRMREKREKCWKSNSYVASSYHSVLVQIEALSQLGAREGHKAVFYQPQVTIHTMCANRLSISCTFFSCAFHTVAMC